MIGASVGTRRHEGEASYLGAKDWKVGGGRELELPALAVP